MVAVNDGADDVPLNHLHDSHVSGRGQVHRVIHYAGLLACSVHSCATGDAPDRIRGHTGFGKTLTTTSDGTPD
jgi:hypothetical protein